MTSATSQRACPTLLHAAVLLVDAQGIGGENRRRVFGYIQAHPGLHQREIARALGLSAATGEHHLRHLERAGLIARQVEAGFVRYYVAVSGTQAPAGSVGRIDKPKLQVLRQTTPLHIVARLLVQGETRMSDLAAQVGISAGTLTYQVKKLEAVGLVRRIEAGSERRACLVDHQQTVELLLAYQPPQDLVAGFEELWDEVGI